MPRTSVSHSRRGTRKLRMDNERQLYSALRSWYKSAREVLLVHGLSEEQLVPAHSLLHEWQARHDVQLLHDTLQKV